jgi:septation ring formation regulator EzrA
MKVVSGQYKILIGTTIEEWGKHEASLRLYCNDMRELIDLETRRIETVVSTIQNSFSEHKALWSELGERFADRLLKIKDELSMLGDPLRDSSKRIDETFSNFTVYVEKNYHPYMKSLLEKLDLTVPIEEMRRSIQSQTEEISSRWNDVKGIVGALDGDGQLIITLDSTDRRHQAVVTAISSVNQSLQALKPDELDARVGQVADRIESIVGSIGRSIGEEIAVSKSVASKLEELIHKISAAGSSAPEPEKRRGLWDIFHR